ncbi:MAG: methylmalonyl-CoA epimerase [Bacteroidaceae bacterium]|nr:methylmalonyl-CoA epimerase [Bacteroidaceae bacterium]MCQ2058726.1 methylmalonyl-CoA epimerase [Bacteroidaceae bacterium]
MKISRIEHLGIACPSIEEALPYFENVLGLKCYKVEEVADQKVKTAFLKVGDTKLELLEPTSPDSTIAKFIENNGGKGGMHHLAFKIEDGVANALAECDANGIRLIDKAPRKGADNMQIAFLHPKSTASILTELCEG